MSERFYLNNNWFFTPEFRGDIIDPAGSTEGLKPVRIPHTVKETPYDYFDESEYQMLSGYRKEIFIDEKFKNNRLILTFEGVAHVADLYVNGTFVLTHRSGYTAFSSDITDLVLFGEKNVIALKVDSREDLMNVPPFGKVIDYMTYGGIYRDVYLDIENPVYIKDIFLKSEFKGSGVYLDTSLEVSTDTEDVSVRQFILTDDGEKELTIEPLGDEDNTLKFKAKVPEDIKKWDVNDPNLYKVRTELFYKKTLTSDKTIDFGFREAVFKKDGFYLNGRKVKLRGLDRHQSYPYVGYAMPASIQALDADVMRYELGLNAVRTSHYPDSHDFIKRCDETGLLVFTEMPGWQYIGDEEWIGVAKENVREMVKEFRNHPSIILWGVRINESGDSDEFYKATNAIAHELDDSRATGGVRNFKKSHFFEDVYTYNDFSHNGHTPGCEPKKRVTSDPERAYLISEYNGHMFPTKAFDCEDKRTEHALRHARVLDAVNSHDDIAGSFGWCMADYNTHKDFGSGDRICYHGVLDMFRNMKTAGYVYAAERDEPFLELSSIMDIGEHPEGNRGRAYIFTNADEVTLYKNDTKIRTYTNKDSEFKNLSHGPILISDYVGEMIDSEGYSRRVTKDIKKVINSFAMNGFGEMPKSVKRTAAKLILINRISMDKASELYGKYIGNWGEKAPAYHYVAKKDGVEFKTITKESVKKASLSANASSDTFNIGKTYDVIAVRLKAVDDNGNQLPFFNEPVSLSVTGPAELIGPNIVSLKGGMGGTYLKTSTEANEGDKVTLTILNRQTETVRLEFTVHKEEVGEL